MRLYKSIIAFTLFCQPFSHVQGQNDANDLLQAVYKKILGAKDYSVQANIKVDMPFIRILPVEVKIYFKQKDKFKVESKSIAVVPRQGFDQISKVLSENNSYTAIAQGDEMIGTILTKIVSVIPNSDTSDIILGKFWIDPDKVVILKSQLTTRSNGTIVTEYIYDTQVEWGLPDEMIFSVDVNKFKMPKNIPNEMSKNKKDNNPKNNGNGKGKIYIKLTNYQVNKGIPDSIFKK